MKIVKNKACVPMFVIISATIKIRPAAGPETWNEPPDNVPTTIPPIMPDINPQ